jgi:hypothetical protein
MTRVDSLPPKTLKFLVQLLVRLLRCRCCSLYRQPLSPALAPTLLRLSSGAATPPLAKCPHTHLGSERLRVNVIPPLSHPAWLRCYHPLPCSTRLNAKFNILGVIE